jgi:hypothetical protein
LLPVAELANPVNRPGMTMALGADQAQQPHEVVWAYTDPPITHEPTLPLYVP